MSAKLTTNQEDVATNGDLTRYRALLTISDAVGTQPTVDAVLHSLRRSVVHFLLSAQSLDLGAVN